MKHQNRVVWNEGLFIKPQHFQHQQRFNETNLNTLLNSLISYGFGVTDFSFDEVMLKSNKVSLVKAKGILKDGTVFDTPSHDHITNVLDLSEINRPGYEMIYFGIPNISEVSFEIDDKQYMNRRFIKKNIKVKDTHSAGGYEDEISVAVLQPRLFHGLEDRSAYSCLPIAKIIGKTDEGIKFDGSFIPTCLHVKNSNVLNAAIDEFAGALVNRTNDISKRLGMPGQQGVADVAEFMLLQVLNRWAPLFTHHSKSKELHPHEFYQMLISLCGEMSTFTDASRLPPEFNGYDHLDLTSTFEKLLMQVRSALSIVLTPRAVSIRLELSNNIRKAIINDQTLFTNAEFILAVNAQMPLDNLQKLFLQQSKFSSSKRMQDLISVQVPGIKLNPLSAAPRQLPYHPGYVYFMLDKTSPTWQEIIENNDTLSLHIAGSFPGLDLQFWAIRGS